MWIDTINRIQILDIKIKSIFDDMDHSVYEKLDRTKEVPVICHLTEADYNILKSEIIRVRKEIRLCFIKSSPVERIDISSELKKFEYFNFVLIPNINFINHIECKEDYIFNILLSISIQNLNDDIRDLIIYINRLKKISSKYNIDFKKLLKKVIPLSSDIAEIYSISMKEFFENILYNKSLPVIVKAN